MKTHGDKRSETNQAHSPMSRQDDLRVRSPGATTFPSGPLLWSGAAAIFVVVTTLVAATANDLGLTWDEPPYRYSQIKMARWFATLASCRSVEEAKPLLTKQAILDSWEYNRFGPNFHPPLAGILSVATHAACWRLLGDLAARRLASGMELALAAAVLFMFLARRYGYWVGAVASASLVLMPRVFGHAHIAGTDMPLMAFWSFTALAFWKGLESRAWTIAFGVLLGLSLLVKFTAILLIVPLVAWLVAYRLIPAWNSRTVVTGLVASLVVAWPLVVAGVEIVRLAAGIRHFTQQEIMLSGAVFRTVEADLPRRIGHESPFREQEVRAVVQGEIERLIGHAAPYSGDELREAALELLRQEAHRRETALETMIGHDPPFEPHELKYVSERLQLPSLALDRYVAWVYPAKNLGVKARVPVYLFFLPLVMWLLWSVASSLPFAPGSMRHTGAGLRLWLAGLALAPAVAIMLNPTWWHETLPQLAHYYQISVGREGSLPDIEIFYLGKKHIYSLPWHNGWMLIAVTVPTAILVFALLGVIRALRAVRNDPLPMFFLLNMLTLPISRMLPTPAHDGVRLMLPTFFFLAGLAGWGFGWVERLVERFRSEEYSTAPVIGIAAFFLLGPPAYWLFRTHPHELSYYNGIVGGLRGAQRLGFEPTYWYDAVTPQVLDDLNDPQRGLPIGATLSLPEPRSILEAITSRTSWQSEFMRSLPEQRINPEVFDWLKHDKLLRYRLRGDILLHNPEATDFPHVALLTHSSKASPFTRLLYALKPHRAWGHDGVRLFSVYDSSAVARAWGLWLLLDATDYSHRPYRPQVDREIIELARANYRALYAAAIRISEEGIDAALEHPDEDETMTVLRKMRARRDALQALLVRRREALVEAVEIISRIAEKRPDLLERLTATYDGYLSDSELGGYLDGAHTTPAP